MSLDVIIHPATTEPGWLPQILKSWIPLWIPVVVAAISWWYTRFDRARIIKATLVTQILNLHDSLRGELKHAEDRKNANSWFVVLPYLDRDVFPLVTSGRVSQQVAQQVVRMHFAYRAALATIAQLSVPRPSIEGVDDLLVVGLSNEEDRQNYLKTLRTLDDAALRALSAIGTTYEKN